MIDKYRGFRTVTTDIFNPGVKHKGIDGTVTTQVALQVIKNYRDTVLWEIRDEMTDPLSDILIIKRNFPFLPDCIVNEDVPHIDVDLFQENSFAEIYYRFIDPVNEVACLVFHNRRIRKPVVQPVPCQYLFLFLNAGQG